MVKYPQMRLQMIWCVRMLADKDYQEKVWLQQQPPGLNYYDSIDDVIHCLFDDTPLAEAPNDTIGEILKNKEEAVAISLVVKAVEKAIENLPNNSPSAVFINSVYWPDVISKATFAYKILSDGMSPNGMYEDVIKHGWSPLIV